MNSRRVFREIVKISREGSAQKSLLRNLFRALLLFIFVFSTSSISAQNTNKQQYDLNDPRNPDCPCHKLQKQADDEYQRQLNADKQFASNFNNKVDVNDNNDNRNQQFLNVGNLNTNSNDNNSTETNKLFNFNTVNDNTGRDNQSKKSVKKFQAQENKISSESGTSAEKNKKKKSSNWLAKKIHRSKLKHSRIKKVRPDYSVCYKW